MAKKENRHAELVSASANIEAPYELPEGWNWVRIGDIAEIINGKNQRDVEDENGVYPIYGSGGIIGKAKKFICPENCTIIGRKGTINNPIFVETKFWNVDTAFGMKTFDCVNPKFYFYFCKSYNFTTLDSSTAIPSLTKTNIQQIPFPLPSTLAEQQRIVNRIETMFAKLDQAQEKAQAVLDSFETRKAAILHKAFTGQLRIDNEELTIEDWEETTIGECCKLGSGGTPSKSHPEYYENGDIPWLKTGEIDWNDIYDVEEKITNEGVENSSAKIFPAESVVVAMYGMGVTRGKAAIIKIPTTTNQAVCVLQPNEKVNNRFLFYYFMCNYWQIREQSVGGNQLNLSGKIIASFSIKLPPLNYQLSIVNFLDTVLEKESRAKEAAQTVLDQIALLKKSILARAFRGEL